MKRDNVKRITAFQEEVLVMNCEEELNDVDNEAIQYALGNNDAVGVVAGYYDEKISISFASHFFLKSLGYDYEDYMESTNNSLLSMVYREDWYLFELDKFTKMKGKREFRMVTKDGSLAFVNSFKTELMDKDKKPMWLLSVRISKESQNLTLVNEVLQSGLWYFDYDEQGNISNVCWSDRFRKMLGFNDTTDFPDVLESWSNLLHPDDKEAVLRVLYASAEDVTDQTKYDVKYRMKMKNGIYKWFRANAEVTRRMNGTPSRMVGIFVNIDKEARADMQKERYDAFHRAYTDTNICEYYVDLQNNTFDSLKVEGSLLEIFEKSTTWDELIHQFIERHVCEEDKLAVALIYNRQYIISELQKINGELSLECRLILDGKERWVRNVVMCGSKDAKGIPQTAIMFVRDITDSKRAEETRNNLIKDKKAQDKVIQSMVKLVDRFAVCDFQKNTYEIYSPSKDIGYAPKGKYSDFVEVVSRGFKLLTADGTIAQVFSIENIRSMIKSETDIYKFDYSALDGSVIRNMSIVPLEWEDGILTKILYIAQDVTREKKAELDAQNALRAACEAANRANLSKTEFLSNMSHDIRTPMNAIIGMTAIAGAHIDQKERVLDCLNKITISSRHLLGLINEILDMSRIERGKMTLAEEEFNFPDLIDNLVTMIKPDIVKHKHDFDVRILNIEHEAVCGDSLRIQQVFTNIMSNAIKYTPDGGKIRFTMSEKPTHHAQIGCYEFMVEDNGMGMSKEFQQILFEPFSRADNKRTTEVQGTGLGMTITKNIVAMMNGSIKVESELGKGSRFTVTMFLKLQDAQTDSQIEELLNLPVLVVDDDEICCESTVNVLNEIGMVGECVHSGEEAIACVVKRHKREDEFFAVIMDWKMPGMDGIETTRQIRKRVGYDIPIILLSAYDCTEIEAEARIAGVDEFIVKPLFKSRLTTTFKQLIAEEETQEEKPSQLEQMAQEDYSKKRILIVEDNELNREIAVEIISTTGAKIETAENGKEAVDLVNQMDEGYYDLVFMDIQMPIMNGYQAASAIRALENGKGKTLPIVAMTANAFAEDVVKAKNAGMDEHIAKPIDIEKLDEVMKKWL